MQLDALSRREFLLASAAVAAGSAASAKTTPRPVVSIVRIRNDKTGMAVEKAIDLLGGIKHVAKGRDTVMLKPNLVSTQRDATTKPEVIRALAEMMKRAGKEVSIGEGSAAVPKFNILGGQICRTRRRDILDPMQQYVFEQLGYADLARTLRIPLVNLHSGEMVDITVPGAFVFDKITLNRSLAETDLLCFCPDDEDACTSHGDAGDEEPDRSVSGNRVSIDSRPRARHGRESGTHRRFGRRRGHGARQQAGSRGGGRLNGDGR
jgi:hypothetical protein